MLCTEWTNECDGRESEVFSYANVRKKCIVYKWALPFFSALTIVKIWSNKGQNVSRVTAFFVDFVCVLSSAKWCRNRLRTSRLSPVL